MSESSANNSSPGHHFTIDMRHHEPRERVPLLELTLSVLKPGESLVVIFPTWPETLVGYLQRQYGDQLECDAGPEHEEWCSLVIRSTTSGAQPIDYA